MIGRTQNTFVAITPALLIISFVPLIIDYFVKRKYKQEREALNDSEFNYYYQVIFFDYKNFNCKPHIINKEECGENCSYKHLQMLIKFILTARESISMCIYMVTYKEIGNALIKARERGVKVKVITDKHMAKTGASRTQILQKNGIPHKIQPYEDSMMHHKYCLIDEDNRENAKMFFGTLNLTSQGFCKNFDNIVLTNDWNIIQQFSEEFKELWSEFV